MKPRQTVQSILLALTLVTAAASVAAAQSAIDVVTLDGKTVTVALSGLARQTINTSDHGATATFEGVLVRDVLAKARVPLGDKLHGPSSLATYVLARAADNYTVVFAIAELDAGFTDQVILLADRRDGAALLPKAGPLQIVVPHEKRGGRWIRQVTRLEVRQAK